MELVALSLFLMSVSTYAQSPDKSHLIVSTEEGQYKGTQFLLENMPVNGFFGIRYAEPPVGRLRWKKPVPIGKFNGVKDALTARPVCTQKPLPIRNFTAGKEDCLFLDIIIGGMRQEGLKPVVVYINSQILYQSGISHTGVMLAKRENLVVVVVNSRLGALGYLYDGPGTGNMGLWDNIVALRWIQRNIKAFGGNPDKVTLMGLESGATLAHLLAASPVTTGLFHQVIAMSPLNTAAKGLHAGDDHEVLKALAGCSSDRTFTCDISDVSAEDIVVNLSHSVPNIMDEELFPGGFNNERLFDYPLLSGVTSAEELLHGYSLIAELTKTTDGVITQPVMDQLVNAICESGFVELPTQYLCFNALRTTFQVDRFAPYPASDVVDILSSYLHSMTVKTITDHAKMSKKPVYAYIVDVADDLKRYRLPETVKGTDKSMMVKLAFGYPYLAYGGKFDFMNSEFYNGTLLTGVDPLIASGGKMELRSQSQDVMRYWANFIKFGDPSVGVKVDLEWPMFKYYDRSFLTIDDSDTVSTRRYFRNQRDYEYFNNFFYKSIHDIHMSYQRNSDQLSTEEPDALSAIDNNRAVEDLNANATIKGTANGSNTLSSTARNVIAISVSAMTDSETTTSGVDGMEEVTAGMDVANV